MYTRLLARALSFIGFILGFTSEVLAQYGAPTYFFTMKGSVKDIECQNPVKNAKVKLIDRNSDVHYTATTDSLGNFTIISESYGYFPEYKIRIEDQDGNDNGQFKDVEGPMDAKKWRSTWNHNPDTLPGDIYLVEYVSGSPCEVAPAEEPPQVVNSEKEPEPQITEPDSALIPKEDPVVSPVEAEHFTNINLFPNPNSGRFSVEFTALDQAATDVYIYSSDGALIYSMSQYAQKGANRFDLELEGLAPGTYYIRLHCFQNDVTKTFVVQ